MSWTYLLLSSVWLWISNCLESPTRPHKFDVDELLLLPGVLSAGIPRNLLYGFHSETFGLGAPVPESTFCAVIRRLASAWQGHNRWVTVTSLVLVDWYRKGKYALPIGTRPSCVDLRARYVVWWGVFFPCPHHNRSLTLQGVYIVWLLPLLRLCALGALDTLSLCPTMVSLYNIISLTYSFPHWS